MDAETRSVAERLRDGLTERGLWPECEGMIVRDRDTPEWGGVVIGPSAAVDEIVVRWRMPGMGDGLRDAWPGHVLPDLSAPATWGVLLGMWWGVRASIPDCNRATIEIGSGHGGIARVRTSDMGADDPPIWSSTTSPGLALARALLAAWGQG